MFRITLIVAAAVMALSFPAIADTRIGVVDLRQGLICVEQRKNLQRTIAAGFRR